jgi:hypothetical protein
MENTNTENTDTKFNRRLKKPGKTVLVKAKEGATVQETWFDSLEGRQTLFKSETSESYFMTFDTIENALTALKLLKVNHRNELYVKFAHYRVFFTIDGLSESSDYNTVKQQHIKFIEDNTNSSVLYYKLYRKDGFLGSGDLTIDTRDGLSALLDVDVHKNYDLGNGLSGTFYRYNKRSKEVIEEEN